MSRALAWGLLALAACGGQKSVPAAPPVAEPAPVAVAPVVRVEAPVVPRRIVLVTIDGVRAEDAVGADAASFARAMPNLARLVAEGGTVVGGDACANEMHASGSYVSLPGYIELFTGKPTACRTNACPPVQTTTVLDEAGAVGDVAVFASWDRYANAVAKDRSALFLSAGSRTPPLDGELAALAAEGARARGYPGWGDYRPDAHTAKLALKYLAVKAPRVLVLGLGDADEQAHRGDFAGYRRAIAGADAVLGDLAAMLPPRTAVLVTTDHGRGKGALLRVHGAAYPGSERVFLAAFGDGIAHRGVACAREPLRLAHVAGAVKALLDVGEGGPLAREIVAPPDTTAME